MNEDVTSIAQGMTEAIMILTAIFTNPVIVNLIAGSVATSIAISFFVKLIFGKNRR